MKILFVIRGKVRTGAKRGKALGFPTANIALHKKIPEGIYISEVILNGHTYQSATFIGSAKSFGEREYKAESFILDFSQNLYGKWITIKLIEKIRDNKKFSEEKELVQQMKKDVEEVKGYFRNKFTE